MAIRSALLKCSLFGIYYAICKQRTFMTSRATAYDCNLALVHYRIGTTCICECLWMANDSDWFGLGSVKANTLNCDEDDKGYCLLSRHRSRAKLPIIICMLHDSIVNQCNLWPAPPHQCMCRYWRLWDCGRGRLIVNRPLERPVSRRTVFLTKSPEAVQQPLTDWVTDCNQRKWQSINYICPTNKYAPLQ